MASRSQANDLINELWSYFRTTDPPEKSVETWINDLLNIELNSSCEYITRKFKSLDKWPSNFPGTIRSFYWSWRKEQPKEQGGPKGCEHCISGMIHATKEGYVYTFNCGHCKTSSNAYPVETRYSLTEKGYNLDWQHDYLGPVNPQIVKKIKKLSKEIRVRTDSEPEELPF